MGGLLVIVDYWSIHHRFGRGRREQFGIIDLENNKFGVFQQNIVLIALFIAWLLALLFTLHANLCHPVVSLNIFKLEFCVPKNPKLFRPQFRGIHQQFFARRFCISSRQQQQIPRLCLRRGQSVEVVRVFHRMGRPDRGTWETGKGSGVLPLKSIWIYLGFCVKFQILQRHSQLADCRKAPLAMLAPGTSIG